MNRSYLEINKKAYDKTAWEFDEKQDIRLQTDKEIANIFYSYCEERAQEPQILDIGPGNGQQSRLLTEKGCNVTAIEFSEAMADIAQKNAPDSNVIVGEFLSFDFGDQKFDGILATAFIHLFPEEDAKKVLAKMHQLLSRNGVAYFSTTKHETLSEGFEEKSNFSKKTVRFRRKLTKQRLRDELLESGFEIISCQEGDDGESDSKTWISFVVRKRISM